MRIEEFPVQNAKPGQVLPLQNANIPNMNIRYNSSGDATCWPTTCNLHVVAKPTFTQKNVPLGAPHEVCILYRAVISWQISFHSAIFIHFQKIHMNLYNIKPIVFIHGHDCTVMLYLLVKIVFKGCFYMLLAPICRQKNGSEGPWAVWKIRFAWSISRYPFCSQPKMHQEPRLKGVKPQEGSLHFYVSRLKTMRKQISK